MRLIDADALIEWIQRDIEKTSIFMNTAEKYDGSFEKLYGQLNALKNYKCIITDMPTAYSVGKVVAELEEEAKDTCMQTDCSRYRACCECRGVENAIKVVRKGGVE